MELNQMLKEAVDKDASDIFLVSGLPLSYKINSSIHLQSEEKLSPDDTRALILSIYQLAGGRDPKRLLEQGDDDFSFSLPGISRFRVSTYKQRGSLAAVIRVVKFELPDPVQMGIPQTVMDLAHLKKGLVLVTGTAGSGKSTTLACMIDRINNSVIQELTLLDTIPAIDPALSGKIKYLTVALMFSEAIERIYQEVSISKLFR